MNAIVEHKAPAPKSITTTMANRYGMEAAAFEATVRATCMRPDKDGNVPNKAEFAAFLLVAREYNLNPLTKEIFAFKQKGGGVVPIVSIDGWMNLINSHPAMDGLEVMMSKTDEGALESATCRIWRKDRSRPVEVTEYYKECFRDTDVWRKWPSRMLRHKATIQCARYAFGFSGIYDEDEGARIVEASVITDTGQAQRGLVAPAPDEEEVVEETADKVVESVPEILAKAREWFAKCKDAEEVAEAWSFFEPDQETLSPVDAEKLRSLYYDAEDRVSA